MPACSQCGENLARSHRKFWEKPIYALVFKCRSCNIRTGAKHEFFNYFRRNARCPRCGTSDIDKRSTRDKIDKVLRTPASLLQAFLGANLYHCVFCRIQFYDFRSRIRKEARPKPANSAG